MSVIRCSGEAPSKIVVGCRGRRCVDRAVLQGVEGMNRNKELLLLLIARPISIHPWMSSYHINPQWSSQFLWANISTSGKLEFQRNTLFFLPETRLRIQGNPEEP